jgi:hypothetical protein
MKSWTGAATENMGVLSLVIAPENLKHYRQTLRDQEITKYGRETGNYKYELSDMHTPKSKKMTQMSYKTDY